MSDVRSNNDVDIAEVAAQAAKVAAEVASKVASEVVAAAKDVAIRAAETASEVAKSAVKTQETVVLFGADIKYIKTDISEIKMLLDNKYVTKEEFKGHVESSDLVKKIVYGACALILVTMLGAIITLVIRR